MTAAKRQAADLTAAIGDAKPRRETRAGFGGNSLKRTNNGSRTQEGQTRTSALPLLRLLQLW
eukprot:5523067-Amphidinium_carterae.1